MNLQRHELSRLLTHIVPGLAMACSTITGGLEEPATIRVGAAGMVTFGSPPAGDSSDDGWSISRGGAEDARSGPRRRDEAVEIAHDASQNRTELAGGTSGAIAGELAGGTSTPIDDAKVARGGSWSDRSEGLVGASWISISGGEAGNDGSTSIGKVEVAGQGFASVGGIGVGGGRPISAVNVERQIRWVVPPGSMSHGGNGSYGAGQAGVTLVTEAGGRSGSCGQESDCEKAPPPPVVDCSGAGGDPARCKTCDPPCGSDQTCGSEQCPAGLAGTAGAPAGGAGQQGWARSGTAGSDKQSTSGAGDSNQSFCRAPIDIGTAKNIPSLGTLDGMCYRASEPAVIQGFQASNCSGRQIIINGKSIACGINGTSTTCRGPYPAKSDDGYYYIQFTPGTREYCQAGWW